MLAEQDEVLGYLAPYKKAGMVVCAWNSSIVDPGGIRGCAVQKI